MTIDWTVSSKHLVFVFSFFITGSIARSASRRYLVYSEAHFEVLRPAGATRCTDGVKFVAEEETKGGSSAPNFTPWVQRQGCRTPKTEFFYSDLTKTWNTNAPHGRIPCAIFTKFAEFVPHFRMR